MIDAVGNPRSLLLLGGTSEIALAIAQKYLARQPLRITLAARPSARLSAVAKQLSAKGATVSTIDFDAKDVASHPAVIQKIFAEGDIDVTVVAFGLLGDSEEAWQDHATAVELATVNYTGAVSVGVVLAQQLKNQGHGKIIALSSVAGERIRRKNFMYGSTKAGFDGFYLGLGEALRPFGISLTVVRPGQVRTKMTANLEKAPLELTAEQAADVAVRAADAGKELVWAPSAFRFVMSVLRHVPRPLFRKLPI